MKLSELVDFGLLLEMAGGRYVRTVTSGDGRHILYDYTEKATFERVWNPVTKACRGLIVEVASGEIVARGLDKFHNLNEYGIPESTLEAVAARGLDYEVWEKLDGSMVLLWWDAGQGEWRTSTRGSFTSAQAQAARLWLSTHVNSWHLDPALCYIGEWVGPDNRVVLSYPRNEWRLIGVRSLADGREHSRDELWQVAKVLGVEPAQWYVARSLDEVCEAAARDTRIEGWVVRWPDGFRVKVKTAEYLELHRLVTNLTPARVHQVLCAGTYDDYVRELPEEHRILSEHYAAQIMARARRVEAEVWEAYGELIPHIASGRKAFALAVQAHVRPELRPYLFSLVDDKPIEEKILKAVVPATEPAQDERRAA